jgi:hypothetical protein
MLADELVQHVLSLSPSSDAFAWSWYPCKTGYNFKLWLDNEKCQLISNSPADDGHCDLAHTGRFFLLPAASSNLLLSVFFF